jgi:hypothetical protein
VGRAFPFGASVLIGVHEHLLAAHLAGQPVLDARDGSAGQEV